jgi:trk system potassium uptake protein TrkA
MYIIVVGGGRLGYYLLKALLNEGHEVLVLEKDKSICKTITDELGSVCFRGDGCEAATLAEVGAGRADMVVSVTGDDEDNLVSCQVAKHKYNVPRTVARIRNPQNADFFKKLGVDVTVSTTNIILEAI